MRIVSIRDVKEGTRYRGDPGKVTVYKQGGLRAKDIKKLNFYVRDRKNCRCEMLQAGKQFFLVMGHKEGKHMYMTFVHSWSKERDFRGVIRDIQEGTGCPVLTTTIASYPDREVAANHGEEIPTEVLFPNSEQVSDSESEEQTTTKEGRKGGKRNLSKEERRALRRQARQEEEEAAAASASASASAAAAAAADEAAAEEDVPM